MAEASTEDGSRESAGMTCFTLRTSNDSPIASAKARACFSAPTMPLLSTRQRGADIVHRL